MLPVKKKHEVGSTAFAGVRQVVENLNISEESDLEEDGVNFEPRSSDKEKASDLAELRLDSTYLVKNPHSKRNKKLCRSSVKTVSTS